MPFRKFALLCILALAPSPLMAQTNEEATKPEVTVLGKDSHRFTVLDGWGKLPGKEHIGPTHGSVCEDSKENIYVALDRGEYGLAVFDKSGKFLRYQAKGFAGIHHLICVKESGKDFLYASHLAGKQAVKMDLKGEVLWKIGCPMESGKYKKKSNYRPTGIAVSSNGSVYVADGYGRNWIHQFDKNQKYVRSFGGPGTKPGQFRTCHSVAIDARSGEEKVLVCDRENRRLQYFDLNGKFLSVSTTGLMRPCCLSISEGYVAVAELAGRVTILDKNNKVLALLGDNTNGKLRANYTVPPKDWKKHEFNAPHGLSFTKDGNLIVLEWNKSGRLVYLQRKKKK